MLTENSTIYLEEVTSLGAIDSLADPWDELWLRDEHASPFQSPQWILNWWRHFGNKNLFSLAIHIDGRLVGMAPLFVNNFENSRIVNFIGQGISDYLGITADAEYAQVCAEVLFDYFRSHRDKWHVCDLQEIRCGSELIKPENYAGLAARVSAQSACPVINLPDSVDTYLACLPGAHRRKVLKAKRMLEGLGQLKLDCAGENDQQRYLNELFALHRASWNMRGSEGVLSGSAIERFHRRTMEQLHQCGCARLYRLRLDERTIAVAQGFVKGNRYYSYLGGFDPEFEHYSPGQVILLEIITECINNGFSQFDFLRGQERYKYLWGAQDEPTYRLLIDSR